MKHLKYIALAGLFMFTSCSDFLDKNTLGQIPDSEFLTDDENNIEQMVNRLYGSLAWREWYIGTQYFTTHEMGADDFRTNLSGNGTLDAFRDYIYDPAHGALNNLWDRTYECLNFCNQVLEYTPGLHDRSIAARAEAQAKYFRAWYNFTLAKTFGDVPLRDHVPSIEEYDIPKSPAEELYKLIVSDLEYAVDNLPTRSEWGTSGLGHVTRGTAQGLLSKVYLFLQDYTNAQKYANQVMTGGEYRLLDSYRDVFSPEQLYSEENMMPGHYVHTNSIWDGRKWNPYLQWQGISGYIGNGSLYPSNELIDAYEDGDPRKKASLLMKGDEYEDATGVYQIDFTMDRSGNIIPDNKNDNEEILAANRKIIWPYEYWNSGEFCWSSVNPMFMRYAEILLIYAEASNELGESSNALSALEQIRRRARGNKTYAEAGVLPEVTETGKDALREIIWNERRIELALEGHRWFDLIRYEKVVSGYMTDLIVNKLGRTNFNYQRHTKLPIPQSKIDSSQGILEQHATWK